MPYTSTHHKYTDEVAQEEEETGDDLVEMW